MWPLSCCNNPGKDRGEEYSADGQIRTVKTKRCQRLPGQISNFDFFE
jgi:hypothetical protein